MKIRSVLLVVSLAANIGLVAWWMLRPNPVRPTAPTNRVTLKPVAANRPTPQAAPDFTSVLATGDAQALAAAGCSPDLIRTILLGRALDRFQSRVRAMRLPDANLPFWRNAKNRPNTEPGAALREFDQSLREALGVDLQGIFDDHPPYGFLSAEKQLRLRQIEHDYDEMEERLRAECQGMLLPADERKLKFLRAERERDLAAALSPEEAKAQKLWSAPTANTVRSTYGDAIQTEEQYQSVYALQEAFDERWKNPPPGMSRDAWNLERHEAAKQLDADVRRIVGEDAWNNAVRASDADARNARLLAERLGLPNVADNVVAMRASYAAQSLQIDADETLTPAQRKAAVTALGARAVNDLKGLLGDDGGAALAQTMQWVQFLRRGSAFSTDPTPARVPHPIGPVLRSFEVPAPRPPAGRPKSPGT